MVLMFTSPTPARKLDADEDENKKVEAEGAVVVDANGVIAVVVGSMYVVVASMVVLVGSIDVLDDVSFNFVFGTRELNTDRAVDTLPRLLNLKNLGSM